MLILLALLSDDSQRDPHHHLTFEKECDYYEVRVVYGDAPAGNDWGSKTTRITQAQANALRVQSNRGNALAGNIGIEGKRLSMIEGKPESLTHGGKLTN